MPQTADADHVLFGAVSRQSGFFLRRGEPAEDLPLVEWSCRMLLYRAQEQLHSLLRNFPNRLVAVVLRMLIFPRGRSFSAPAAGWLAS